MANFELGVKLINEKLHLHVDYSNLVLKRSDKKGFSYEKINSQHVLTFFSDADFYHALGLMISNNENTRKDYSPNLGIMLDCSRNAVPTVDFLKQYLIYLVLIGYDYLGMYIEDLIEVDEEPYFGYKKGRYSASEINELVDFARTFGFEIVPYIQTLAHLNGIFKWNTYWEINDTDDILLSNNERTYQLIDHILASVKKAFKCSRINIGMDEAFMVGRGKYTDINGFKNKSEVMEEHLNKVLELTDKYGFVPEMWSDMFVSNNFKSKINDKVKLIYWDYENTQKEKYLENIDKHYELTKNVGFAGANWTWVGIAPLNTYALNVSKAAIEACIEKNINDLCFTSWGDLNAECPFNSSFAVIISNACQLLKTIDSCTIDNFCKTLFNYSYEELMYVEEPNKIKNNPRNNCSYLMFYQDVILDLFGGIVCEKYSNDYRIMKNKFLQLSKRVSPINYVFKSLYCFTNALEIKSTLGARIKKFYRENNKKALRKIVKKDIPELIKRLDLFNKSIYASWEKEKKSYGFDNINMKLGSLIYSLKLASSRITDYIKTNKPICELDETDLKYFTFFYDGLDEDERQKNEVTYTNHINIVTNSRSNY